MRKYQVITTGFVVLCLATILSAQNNPPKQVTVVGISNLSQQPGSAVTEVGNETRSAPEEDVDFRKPPISGNLSPARVRSAHVPTPAGSAFGSTAADNFF